MLYCKTGLRKALTFLFKPLLFVICTIIIDHPRRKTRQLLRSLTRVKVRTPTRLSPRQHAEHVKTVKNEIWACEADSQKPETAANIDRGRRPARNYFGTRSGRRRTSLGGRRFSSIGIGSTRRQTHQFRKFAGNTHTTSGQECSGASQIFGK